MTVVCDNGMINQEARNAMHDPRRKTNRATGCCVRQGAGSPHLPMCADPTGSLFFFFFFNSFLLLSQVMCTYRFHKKLCVQLVVKIKSVHTVILQIIVHISCTYKLCTPSNLCS
jgi:hypothetical protein